MPEDDKKKVKVRPGYNPRTNAMRTRREGAPGSGTRQGKANRGGQGQTKPVDLGKAAVSLLKKGVDRLEKGNEDKPSPYIGLKKRYKTKEEWLEDQKKK